jgi:hypothetical protein
MAIGAVVGVLLVGCWADSAPPTSSGWSTGASSSGGNGSAVSYDGGAASSSTGGGSSQPMLVDVDPNLTLTAKPGDGVGVFTEYRTGGHWHVWWTCDTNATNLPCSFQIAASVASSAITNVSSQLLEASDQLTRPGPQDVQVVTTTSTGVDGVQFDVPAGASITLDVQLNGQRDGSFLFFAQGGQVNGGYPGTLSDPLMLEPSSP